MVSGKSFSKMDKDELADAVDAKRALPDMVLKRMFFTFQETMTRAEQDLMLGFYMNGGYYNDNDVFRFRSSILGLFRLISGMMLDAGVLYWGKEGTNVILAKNRVKSDYALCLKLTQYAQMDVSSLVHLSGYLNYALHKLGLTDLLMDNELKEVNIADII